MTGGHHRTTRSQAMVYLGPRRGKSEINCCVKYTVFGFNVVFWIVGFLLLTIGAWAQIEKNNPYSQLNRASKFYLDPAWILIVVGAVTFLIGFSGCIGALRENTCFLSFYSSLLGLLLLTETALAVLAFSSKEWINMELRTRLDDMVIMYRDDPDLQTLIDWMQQDWKCCGINKADDWDMNIYFNASATALKSEEAGGVPFSCCISKDPLQNFACGHRVRLNRERASNSIYTEGCLPKLQQWLDSNILIVCTVTVGIAIIQILSICFAQDLRSDVFAQRARCMSSPESENVKDVVINRIRDSLQKYEREEGFYRRMCTLYFVIVVVFGGISLWWVTTSTPRAYLRSFTEDHVMHIPATVRLGIVRSADLSSQDLDQISSKLLEELEKFAHQSRFSLKFSLDKLVFSSLKEAEVYDAPHAEEVVINLLLIASKDWPYFSSKKVHLGSKLWSYAQWDEADLDRTVSRLNFAIRDIMIDIDHLVSIVRRDTKNPMGALEIASLPSSQQKRHIWDSAALSVIYNVHLIYLHNLREHLEWNDVGTNSDLQHEALSAVNRFGNRIRNVTDLHVTAEHLWDFDLASFLTVDVQKRNVISHKQVSKLIASIDAATSTVESAYPLIKLLVIESSEPIVLIDEHTEDAFAFAVASWGGIISPKILDEDSVLRTKNPSPVSNWEIERLKLRSFVDNTMRCISSVEAIHQLTRNIATLAVSNYVSQLVNSSVEFLDDGVSKMFRDGVISLDSVLKARFLADKFINEPSLLGLLHFSYDMKLAVYLPLAFPILMPVASSILAVVKRLIYDTQKQ
ncbi:hypothetical protein QR680_002260 [Steinernema hermaphroditum]|uniref:Tetraspanin n=1 Tax=Steinernema hermaphroditum TaxID=289476 RepID=A0AA39H3S9_9BILA|nr:hypothetical protein QR680_002260 [Steinernema hermaphroditum]